MCWKCNLTESLARSLGRLPKADVVQPDQPRSILVLNLGGIGDLLVITPLFQALKQRYPAAKICAGVSAWNIDTLANNPFVDEIITLRLPIWKEVESSDSFLAEFSYCACSKELSSLANRHFDIGIDPIGSRYHLLIMLGAGIPYRLVVLNEHARHRNYQKILIDKAYDHVGNAALKLAQLLKDGALPVVRPQIFLTAQEKSGSEKCWTARSTGTNSRSRIVLGIGASGRQKCWPIENFVDLTKKLALKADVEIVLIGDREDNWAAARVIEYSPTIANYCGKLTLRETFALVAASDMAISNASMLFHVAAAFDKPHVVLLSDAFDSREQHMAGWGYGGLSHTLGKGAGKSEVASPDEAFAAVEDLIGQLG